MELRFCRPRTKDFIAAGIHPARTVAADTALLASITGEPEIVIKQLDIDDLAKLHYECASIWAAYFDMTDGYSLNPRPEATEPKEIIELEHKVTRIGLTFRVAAEDVVKLKRQILDTSLKYIVNSDSITEVMDVLLTNTGDIERASEQN